MWEQISSTIDPKEVLTTYFPDETATMMTVTEWSKKYLDTWESFLQVAIDRVLETGVSVRVELSWGEDFDPFLKGQLEHRAVVLVNKPQDYSSQGDVWDEIQSDLLYLTMYPHAETPPFPLALSKFAHGAGAYEVVVRERGPSGQRAYGTKRKWALPERCPEIARHE
jgi:hypothetical protein